MGTQKRVSRYGRRFATTWWKRKPVAAPSVCVSVLWYLYGLTPFVVKHSASLQRFGEFLWLPLTSLQPFVLFVVIYSRTEAPPTIPGGGNPRRLWQREMSKRYKEPHFPPLQCGSHLIILAFTAACLFAAGFVLLFKPVILRFHNILPISPV